MATGLFLLTAGLAWAAIRGSLSTNWVELDIALLIAGTGVSMALPTVPTAVLNAVDPKHAGSASGFNSADARTGGRGPKATARRVNSNADAPDTPPAHAATAARPKPSASTPARKRLK